MAGKGRKSRVEPQQLFDEFQTLMDAVNGESPLACVLITASHLDEALATLLSKFLIESKTATDMLYKTTGMLANLDARRKLAYGLALISKTVSQNIEHILEIRNIFAHERSQINFDDPRIIELCVKLEMPAPLSQHIVLPPDAKPALPGILANARPRFTVLSVLTIQVVLMAILNVQRRQRPEDQSPQ